MSEHMSIEDHMRRLEGYAEHGAQEYFSISEAENEVRESAAAIRLALGLPDD